MRTQKRPMADAVELAADIVAEAHAEDVSNGLFVDVSLRSGWCSLYSSDGRTATPAYRLPRRLR